MPVDVDWRVDWFFDTEYSSLEHRVVDELRRKFYDEFRMRFSTDIIMPPPELRPPSPSWANPDLEWLELGTRSDEEFKFLLQRSLEALRPLEVLRIHPELFVNSHLPNSDVPLASRCPKFAVFDDDDE